MSIKKNSTSSTFSAESADSALDSNQPDLFGRSHSVNETSSAKPSSANTGLTFQSLTTCEPSQQMDLEELTSSSVASHASPGPKPGSSEAQKMTVTSGRKWVGLLESYNLAGQFAKMCGALLTNQWASSAAFLTWRASATKPFHLLFQLAPSMPRTAEIESGSLHTPTSKANQTAPSMKERDPKSWWRTPMAADGTHNHCLAPSVLAGKTTMTLTNQVRGVQRGLWATPRVSDTKDGRTLNERGQRVSKSSNLVFGANLADQMKLWPTPATRDYKGANSDKHLAKARGHHDQLPNAVKMVGGTGGQLNPTWVEWLMGYPIGWTDLKPSEMPSCRKSSGKSAERF